MALSSSRTISALFSSGWFWRPGSWGIHDFLRLLSFRSSSIAYGWFEAKSLLLCLGVPCYAWKCTFPKRKNIEQEGYKLSKLVVEVRYIFAWASVAYLCVCWGPGKHVYTWIHMWECVCMSYLWWCEQHVQWLSMMH